MAKEEDSFVDPRNARDAGYKNDVAEIDKLKVCPFCPGPNYLKWHKKPILEDNGLWMLTENTYPYENSSLHLLLICKDHKEDLGDLNSDYWQALLDLSQSAQRRFDISGGGFTLRFGETRYTGATVKHLHAHIVVPTVTDTGVSPVYFPIG